MLAEVSMKELTGKQRRIDVNSRCGNYFRYHRNHFFSNRNEKNDFIRFEQLKESHSLMDYHRRWRVTHCKSRHSQPEKESVKNGSGM
jgi:hypothetical protein